MAISDRKEKILKAVVERYIVSCEPISSSEIRDENLPELSSATIRNELAALEAIVHPAVGRAQKKFLARHRARDVVVLDIPLLFEKGGSESVDVIVVVSAPADVQRARVLARPGMTPEKFEKILSIQVPDAEKRARGDHIIDTGVTLEETRAAVRRLIATLSR